MTESKGNERSAFDVCYMDSASLKRLTVVSPTFQKFFWQYKLCLPHECLGTLLNPSVLPKLAAELKPAELKQKTHVENKKTQEPYFGDDSVLKDATPWFKAVQLCYAQKRIKTLQIPVLVVHGTTGSGKTFLVQKLSREYGLHVQSVSLSRGVNALQVMSHYGNLMTKYPVLYLQDVSLWPKEWLPELHRMYQEGRIRTPLIVELDTEEYYRPRYLKPGSEKQRNSYTISLFSFWKHEAYVKHIRTRTQTKHIRLFLNWLGQNFGNHTEMIATAAHGDFRCARRLFHTTIATTTTTTITTDPRFRSLFDVGAWFFHHFPTERRSPFRIAEFIRVFGSDEPTAKQLSSFLQSWILSFGLQKTKEKEQTDLTSWDSKKNKAVLKAEQEVLSFAKRKGYVSAEEEKTESWMIRPSEYGFLSEIAKESPLKRFGVSDAMTNKEAKQEEAKQEEPKRIPAKPIPNKTKEMKETNDLCVLSSLCDLSSEFDAYAKHIDDQDEIEEEMKTIRVLAEAEKLTHLSRKTHPYKHIVSWFGLD